MSENDFEFEDDLFIDLNRLEWEAARQAQLFGKWAKRWAKAAKTRDRANERVKTKRSELQDYLRRNYKDLGYNKEPTGPQSEAFYRIDDEYKKLKRRAHNAEHEVNMLYVAMRSFEHKRSMIPVEEKLYAQDYFSTPYEVSEFREKSQGEMEQAQDEALGDTTRIPKKLVRRKEDGTT
jgi:hypothetical protein